MVDRSRAGAPLVIVGAGGFARETAELVAAINERESTWQLLGFVDDDERLHGRQVGRVPVLGGIDYVRGVDAKLVVCVGNPASFSTRARIVERLGLDPSQYASLVHPTSVLGESTRIGEGTVIHALCVSTCDAQVGAHVAVMPATVLTHDDVVADYVTIGAGVRLAGNVRIGAGAYLGAGSMIRENRSIGERSLIGMGSVVTKNVPAEEVWAGVPARFVRAVEEPPTTSRTSGGPSA